MYINLFKCGALLVLVQDSLMTHLVCIIPGVSVCQTWNGYGGKARVADFFVHVVHVCAVFLIANQRGVCSDVGWVLTVSWPE